MSTALGERLRRERVARKQTQGELAAMLGISQPAYYRWESGEARPKSEHYRTLAIYLGLTVAEVWSLLYDDSPAPVALDTAAKEIARLKREVALVRSELTALRDLVAASGIQQT